MSRRIRFACLCACGVAMALLTLSFLAAGGATRVMMLMGLAVFEAGIVGGLVSVARHKES